MKGVESAPSHISAERAIPKQFGNIQIATEQFTPFVKPSTGTVVRTERNLGVVRAGETTYIGNTQVSVEQLETPPKPASDTVARSEGAHAFLAYKRGIGVRIATIQSGPGYLGKVEVDRPDAIVAAGHRKGNFHDTRVIRALGADVEASYRTAESILRGDPDGYDAVTLLLEERRTVNGHQIREAVEKARERKEFVLVVFKTPEGRAFKKKTRAEKGVITVEEINSATEETTIFDPLLNKKHLALAS